MIGFEQGLQQTLREYLDTQSMTLDKWLRFMNLISYQDRWIYRDGKILAKESELFQDTLSSLFRADLESAALLYCVASELPEVSQIVRDWQVIAYVGKRPSSTNIVREARKLVICNFSIRLRP